MKKTNAVLKIHLGKRVLMPFFFLGFLLFGAVGLNAQSYVSPEKAFEIVETFKKDFYAQNPVLNARTAALPASAANLQIKSEFLELFPQELQDLKNVESTLNGVSTILISDRGYNSTVVNAVKAELDDLLRK
jgi:hypothetical protein